MAGRGNIVTDKNNEFIWNDVTPPECSPNPSILRFASNNSWVPAKEPLHADIDVTKAKVCGVGPGMAFANHLLKRDPAVGVIGLVPRTYAALRDGGGQIRALLWYQGESEANDANGSQLQNDRVHLTSTAQVHLGIVMANAFLQISHS
nr:probable carbohydrate esterase At4g34215 [Ipomoea batatas]